MDYNKELQNLEAIERLCEQVQRTMQQESRTEIGKSHCMYLPIQTITCPM